MSETRTLLAVMAALFLLPHAVLAGDEAPALAKDKQALAALQAYVGAWRGVGLPKRGSNRGAWTEGAEWSWKFEGGRASLECTLDDGRFYESLVVKPGEESDRFVLLAYPTADEGDGEAAPQRFTGTMGDDGFVVTADDAEGEEPARISVRLVAGGDRMLVLYEKRVGDDAYARLAEVGSTRKGSSFAKNAAAGPECVVTGGLGTIAVEHEGKTYYVCCGGCKELFEEDPAGVLADYQQRKAEQRGEESE